MVDHINEFRSLSGSKFKLNAITPSKFLSLCSDLCNRIKDMKGQIEKVSFEYVGITSL